MSEEDMVYREEKKGYNRIGSPIQSGGNRGRDEERKGLLIQKDESQSQGENDRPPILWKILSTIICFAAIGFGLIYTYQAVIGTKGSLWAVTNADIYNGGELLKTIQLSGVRDTKVISERN